MLLTDAHFQSQEITTICERPINEAKLSSVLVRRAYNSRSDHVCPASVRNRDYNRSCGKENSISCSCYQTRNVDEDISELRDECSGGDAVDTVPSRECGEFASDNDRKNEFVKLIDRDRCDVASRLTNDSEAVRSVERILQTARPTSYHHCKARCPSRPCSNPNVNPSYDSASCERHNKVACGDFTEDRSKEFASKSCHGTSIDLGGNAEEDNVTNDTRGHSSDVEDMWTRENTLTKSHPTHRKIMDSTWRCQCECHPHEDSIPNLSRSSCDRCGDGCCHRYDHHCNCSHRRCCYQQCDNLCMNMKGCEMHGSSVSGEKAQHKSWCDQMQGENSRLYARQCYSKEYSGIISASRERNDEERSEKNDDDDNEDEDDDDGVAVINHKDSMCILAEKYKASRKWRSRKCEDRERSNDRTGDKDECNKSLTSEIIDQPGSPLEIANAISHEGPNVRHSCRVAHCESCGTAAIARTCGRGCGRHGQPEGEFDRLSPFNETTATRCCSGRASCRRVF